MSSCARRRLFWCGVIFGLCTLLALLSAVGGYVSELGMGHTGSLELILHQHLKNWYACGLLALAAIWVSARNPLQPGHGTRWVLRHLGADFVLAMMIAVLTAWLVSGERSVRHPGTILTFPYLLKTVCIDYFLMNVVLYWLVVFGHVGWTYYHHNREREKQTAELQRELVEARLAALRMQLNPHFLFNTLHAISSLIHENPEAADRVLARLSELLRLSLDPSKPQEVPLDEELVFLERYLEIELTRFADRLKVEKQIDPAAKEALVPYLILQPLVENAIRHGIEPREDSGRLAISARRNNGRLELCVSDDGAGFPGQADAPPREGIGLSNTRSRLQHLYGAAFRFELIERQGGGLEARIDIPYHTKTDHGQ